MGLIRTLADYGQQAYEGLKPPAKNQAGRTNSSERETENYAQLKLSGHAPLVRKPRLELNNFQQQLGQDSAYVQNTLRQKLAEYGLPDNASLKILRDQKGNFKAEGRIRPDIAAKIEFDLNQNAGFKQRFIRLAQHSPTLNYLQNIMRINSTYGGENQVLNSLLSENPQNNSLQDISQRFDKLNKATGYGSTAMASSDVAPTTSFSVNV